MSPEAILLEQKHNQRSVLTFDEWFDLNKQWFPSHFRAWIKVIWEQAQLNYPHKC